MSTVGHVTSGQFEQEVLKSDRPVLVDFYAEWCGPCRLMGPVLDKLAAELNGQAKIVKINVDEEPALAQRFGISGVPTLILFKGGQVAETIVGLTTGAALKTKLQQLSVATAR